MLSDRDVLRIGLALCGALGHAHGRGVVHRDVKPQNVIVPDAPRRRRRGQARRLRRRALAGDEPLTRTGDVVGTLAYMAPEQAAGQRVDERADLYSLALVLYEALAGREPVRAGFPAATARRVGTVLPALRRSRKDLPEELGAAIDRALRPRPDERGTLDDLAAALADTLPRVSDDGGTVAAAPAGAHGTARFPALGRPRGAPECWRAVWPRAVLGGGGRARAAFGGRRRRGGGRPSRAWPGCSGAFAAIGVSRRAGPRRRRARRRGRRCPCRCCCCSEDRYGLVRTSDRGRSWG